MGVGLVSVGLGILGMFMPLLPTTPFLLLAAVCFSRSSPRLHRWLFRHRWLGPVLTAYIEGRGVPRGVKTTALATMWPTMALAMYIVPLWPVRVLLLAVAIGVSAHILRLPNAEPPPQTAAKPEPSEA